MGKKRKQKTEGCNDQSPPSKLSKKSDTSAPKILSKLLQKKILVLSTIDPDAQAEVNRARKDKVEGEAHIEPVSTQQYSYSDLADLVVAHSGVVMQIMGKKTYAVITTSSARSAATQKVRKAYKKCVPIVDVSWVEDSISSNSLLSLDSYRRENDVKKAVEKKEEEKQRRLEAAVDVDDAEPSLDPSAEYWSEPVSFGCSCVCHENNPGIVTDCAWCSGCSINLKLLATKALKLANNNSKDASTCRVIK
ncbi:hypothetical protein TrCOL_g189 [Triparma columacea]|uniref:BRCT domain-containing protein n=1 Tax=Triparma columacea TaxID=722753 RepID=A0A9W7GDN2_9STRA|nr:hypothetical protein TrCOL_g189 [Triparma columacea]